jgi:hypothetical protein
MHFEIVPDNLDSLRPAAYLGSQSIVSQWARPARYRWAALPCEAAPASPINTTRTYGQHPFASESNPGKS